MRIRTHKTCGRHLLLILAVNSSRHVCPGSKTVSEPFSSLVGSTETAGMARSYMLALSLSVDCDSVASLGATRLVICVCECRDVHAHIAHGHEHIELSTGHPKPHSLET